MWTGTSGRTIALPKTGTECNRASSRLSEEMPRGEADRESRAPSILAADRERPGERGARYVRREAEEILLGSPVGAWLPFPAGGEGYRVHHPPPRGGSRAPRGHRGRVREA